MFKKILYSISIILSISQIETFGCPPTDDTIYFIGNPEDIIPIENCSYLNSSLFITGDYNIIDLRDLSKLEKINSILW